MDNIKQLIKKYDTPYVPGEKRSKEYERQIRTEQRLKKKYVLVDELITEAKYLTITNSQRKEIKHLVRTFNNHFKELHRKASNEQIILSFMFMVLIKDEPKIYIQNYSITKKYRLNNSIFETIICRLVNYYMRQLPTGLEENNLHDNSYWK